MRGWMRRVRVPLLCGALGVLFYAGCGPDEPSYTGRPSGAGSGGSGGRDAGPEGGPGGDGGAMAGSAGAAGGQAGENAGGMSGAGMSAGGMGGGAGAKANCGDIVCRGHGSCQETESGAVCVCDAGYVLNASGDECIVDETCIKLRFLEPLCRTVENGPPAVGLFFAADYCAGTAVLPEKLGDPRARFKILEDGVDIDQNVESSWAVIPKGVESFVTIALDVSESVSRDDPDLLRAVIEELKDFTLGLEPEAGGPPVAVSVLLFGAEVIEYVPFTRTLSTVATKLDELAQDPEQIGQMMDIGGTALNDAVKKGIEHTERVQKHREIVTKRGVLSTGTLVVITDGIDSANPDLDNEKRIKDTLVNIISIGISSENIGVLDSALEAIGRDGSFLAPTAADRAQAFDEIQQRVDQYPERAYLLAYCSSRRSGESTVTITMSDPTPAQTASCKFDAGLFIGGACDEALFADDCDGMECGGLTACGACADDECCAGGQCVSPGPHPSDCRGQDALCPPTQRCVRIADTNPVEYECVAGGQPGDPCSNAEPCAAGIAYCDTDADQCLPVEYTDGVECGTTSDHPADVCPDLNCSRVKLGSTVSPYVCKPRARMFDVCSGQDGNAVCEPGSFCKGSVCTARQLSTCSSDTECSSGWCNTDIDRCIEQPVCYYDWASIVSTQ